MFKLQVSSPAIWLLCTFLSIASCFTSFQLAQAAAVTDPNEVIVLKSLAQKWSTDLKTSNSNTWKTPWNLTGDPCTGRAIDGTDIHDPDMNLAFKCDCIFNNGVTCHVTQLRVSADISGEIPEELANLTYLWYLKMDQNYLTGPIPAFLGNLTRLQKLSIALNNLSGPVPKQLGNLHKLKVLSFGHNYLNGSLPQELGNLGELEELYINSAGLSGEIPSTFGKLQKLKILWLSDNQFTGGIPDLIGNLRNLIDLRLQGNAFKGPIPSNFSYLTSLTKLRVSDITSGVSSLAFLKNLKTLTDLVLRDNMISGELPSYIGELSLLQSLDLSFNNFTGGIPDSLQNLSNLTFLFLGNNNLSGKLPSQKSASLKYIDLSYNRFSGALPSWLGNNDLNVNLVGNYFTANEISNRFSQGRLDCLQRTFPCNKGTPLYARFAINCGGGQTTYAGDVFEPENETLNAASFYVSDTQKWGVSDTGSFLDSSHITYIANNSIFTEKFDSELYKTARLSPSSLRYYGLGLENGPYTVKLHFAEIQFENGKTWNSLGRRVFDVYVQGHKVLTDFDIRKEAGRSNIGVVKSFKKTNVTENFLEIHFFWAGKGTYGIPFQGTYGPLVSAISVTPEFNPTVGGSMSKKSKTGIVIGITLGIAVALVCIILVFLLRRMRVQKRSATDVEEDEGNDKRLEEDEEIKVISSKLKIFSYADMKTATGDFGGENKLGEGGYGAVYKGTLSDGEMVAVKQLSSESRQGKRAFINEVAVISAVQHRNLVKLHGCCVEPDDPLLIYEYLENKSIDKILLGNTKSHMQLDWPTRYNICIGTARGLAYLHEEASPRIIHRDIKASNILLDDSLNPMIADFGLAKLFDDEETHIITRVAGTVGYLSPEYAMRGHLTEKVDVFSFGVVALELVSGRSNTDTNLPKKMVHILEWTWHLYEKEKLLELMDPALDSTCSKEEVLRVIEVALLCTQALPTMRPSMSRVVAMLTGDIKIIPAASRPAYITDLQYNNFIAGSTGTGSTPVVATSPLYNAAKSSFF